MNKEQLVERLNAGPKLMKSDLKGRGWTEAAIEQILVKPDCTKLNPHYHSGPPVKLYRTSRVEIAENTEEFAGFMSRKRLLAHARRTSPATHDAKLTQKWPDWREAIPDACEFLFSLNRYAKHKSCRRENREEIYELKNRFVALLYKLGYCKRCWLHTTEVPARKCYSCNGEGVNWDERECGRCRGTGKFREAGEVDCFCFEFVVGESRYTWHQPDELVDFDPPLTDPPQDWSGTVAEKPIAIPRRKLTEGKHLLRWLVNQTN